MLENKMKENVSIFRIGKNLLFKIHRKKKSQNKLVIDSTLTMKALVKQILLAPRIVIFNILPRENSHKCKK